MISRVQTELTDEVIERIAGTVAAWRGERTPGEYQTSLGYCRSVQLAEIAEHGHVLTPGRYVGAEAVEDDDEAFRREDAEADRESWASRWRRGRNSTCVDPAEAGGAGV
jgi:type I restriction enzyme M protein